MKKGIIGKKIGMSQIFDENGNVIPVTIIEAGPCVVAQKKTVETDGYNSVQLGFEDVSEKKLNKAVKGHFKKAGVSLKRHLKEFKLDNAASMNVGDVISADVFVAGDRVDVTGTSKGHGYSDVIKATGAVDALVSAAVGLMGGNKIIAATVITIIGLLVTMGIGSSFSTVPVVAILYVPLCQQMGFSVAATAVLMSAAAALGDAGSPASDTTLGPTSGLNADGQHDHIWDTCVPTFIHYNIPLMIAAIVVSQFI